MKNLLFLLSAIGGLNGLFLSAYFTFFIKKRNKATCFLASLLLAVSTRITKSAFLHFNGSAGIVWFVQIGLIACALIGPFLYLYVKEECTKTPTSKYGWLLHVVPVFIILPVLFYLFPYRDNSWFWNPAIRWGIYSQWVIYIIISVFLIKEVFNKLFKRETLQNKDIWLLNLVVGVFIIWLAYRTSQYTSYMVGALSFSFVFYMSIVLWVLKRKSNSLFFDTEIKYKNTSISKEEIHSISEKLTQIFNEEKLYKNPNLKLKDVAEKINISSHQLSQFLNNNLKKSFNLFVNEFRIEEAKQLLQTNHQFTLEAIGYEAGFSSKSTFYATFKKISGVTPAQFRKQILA